MKSVEELYEIVPVRGGRGKATLTYASAEVLRPGQIVTMPLGRGRAVGVVWGRAAAETVQAVAAGEFKARAIERVLYTKPLPRTVLTGAKWLAKYYLVPLGAALGLFLPKGVEKQRRKKKSAPAGVAAEMAAGPEPAKIPLNAAQKRALKELREIKTATKLLHGVTGSGKTNIYLELMRETLAQGRSGILLVPEIALTSQLVEVFRAQFGDRIALIHSRQTEAERHLMWERILLAEEPLVVIGPRSALLTPVKNLDLIIVDEAHEGAYFQENAPKYSAVRLASAMAAFGKLSCVLGTATPTITDYYLARERHSLVTLKEKAKATTPAKVKVVKLGEPANFSKNKYFSDALLAAIGRNLKTGQQTLIFHNRRGSAPLTLCEQCGWQALCPTCFLPLTLHADDYSLHCHTCGFQTAVPSGCPECGHAEIVHKGFGTKLLESELRRLFPAAKIGRFDADNTKEEALEQVFTEVREGQYEILVGTQTLARGLDLPLLATVGVVQADAGLMLPDFAAEERTFQLLTQVTGRVGRGHLETAEVFVQTYRPEHPVLQAALKADYTAFADYVLAQRRRQGLPPYRYLARINVVAKTEKTVLTKVRAIARGLAAWRPDSDPESDHGSDPGSDTNGLLISPPLPAFHERTLQGYNWQIIVRARSRQTLVAALEAVAAPVLQARLTLDPPSLL